MQGEVEAIPSLQRPGPDKACAAYDLHHLTLIEDHGRAEEIPAEALFSAMATLTDARHACRTGDVERALRLYGFLALGPPRVAPGHWVVLR